MRNCGFVPIPSAFWKYLGVHVEAEASLGAPPPSLPGHFQSVLGRGGARMPRFAPDHLGTQFSRPVKVAPFSGGCGLPLRLGPAALLLGVGWPFAKHGQPGQGLFQACVWWGISLPSADLHILSLSLRGSWGSSGAL